MDEVEQIDAEPKGDEVKLLPRVSNGSDSGHPSSRNFSVTSGMSDSLSTEDSGAQEISTRASTQENMEDHKKEEAKKTSDVGVEKMEKSVLQHAGGETEKGEMEDVDVEQEGLEQEESEKRNEVEVGKHSEANKPEENSSANTSASIKNDESKKIQVSKAEPSENETELKPKMNVAERAGNEPRAETQGPCRVKEKDQVETVRKKVTMPSAPVIKEIVVPVVFEAFSMREMSKETPTTDSDESPSAIEMEEIPMARLVGVEEGSESLLPEMEPIYPQYDTPAAASEKNITTSPGPSTGTTYSVHILFIGINV